jgi:shikimate kinase
MKNSKHIALIGLKSVGKSTLGKVLANHLKYDFLDLDTLIEENYLKEKAEPLSFKMIHQNLGDSLFRALEDSAVLQAIRHNKKAVIATGGSTLLNETNQKLFKENTSIVYLDISKKTLYQRWQTNWPTFINSKNKEAAFETYYNQRAPLYHAICDTRIGVEGGNVDNLVKEIVATQEI